MAARGGLFCRYGHGRRSSATAREAAAARGRAGGRRAAAFPAAVRWAAGLTCRGALGANVGPRLLRGLPAAGAPSMLSAYGLRGSSPKRALGNLSLWPRAQTTSREAGARSSLSRVSPSARDPLLFTGETETERSGGPSERRRRR